jgi:hypothetical protein
VKVAPIRVLQYRAGSRPRGVDEHRRADQPDDQAGVLAAGGRDLASGWGARFSARGESGPVVRHIVFFVRSERDSLVIGRTAHGAAPAEAQLPRPFQPCVASVDVAGQRRPGRERAVRVQFAVGGLGRGRVDRGAGDPVRDDAAGR